MIKIGIFRPTAYLLTGMLVCGLSTHAHAQNPGYAGQHVLVYGIFEPSANLMSYDYINPNVYYFSDIFADQLEVSDLYTYTNPIGLGLDITLSKSISVGANFRYINIKMPLNVYYLQVDGEDAYDFAYVGETRLTGALYGIYLKKYAFNKHGSIAPIGRYTKYEWIFGTPQSEGYGFAITEDEGIDYYLSTDKLVSDYSLVNIIDSKTLLFRFTWGSQHVYFNKMVLDIGLFGTLSVPVLLSYSDMFDLNDAYYTGAPMHMDGLVKAMRLGININPGIFVY